MLVGEDVVVVVVVEVDFVYEEIGVVVVVGEGF